MKLPFIAMLALIPAIALADDCMPITDALAKQAVTPLHSTTVSASGKAEMVRTADAAYTPAHDKWIKRPYNGAAIAGATLAGFKQEVPICPTLGSETLAGKPPVTNVPRPNCS